MKSLRAGNGFTLLEVMIALFVLAVGAGAAVQSMFNSSRHFQDLERHYFANLVAHNQMVKFHLDIANNFHHKVNVTDKTSQTMASRDWQVNQLVSKTPRDGYYRIDIEVFDVHTEESITELSAYRWRRR